MSVTKAKLINKLLRCDRIYGNELLFITSKYDEILKNKTELEKEDIFNDLISIDSQHLTFAEIKDIKRQVNEPEPVEKLVKVRRKSIPNKVNKDQILALFKKGFGDTAIAREMNLARTSVASWRRKLKLAGEI